MELYGTTTRQLAEVSVAFRKHACLHPDAVMKKPITIEDHESARPIVEPLRLLDYCLINDGAVCIILTTHERAARPQKPPVRISGLRRAGELSATRSISNFDRISGTTTSPRPDRRIRHGRHRRSPMSTR